MKLLIAAAVAVFVYMAWGRESPAPPAPVAQGAVVLYATDWCGYCRQTRTFLTSRGIPFTEFDIEKSEEGARRYKAIGVRGVPVVVVNGTVVKGHDPKAILAALK